MQYPIDNNILLAMKLLLDNGYEAYLVGGAVRDFVLDVPQDDYDIATNASLDEAIQVFKDYKTKKYIGKGITLGVVVNHTHFELSTYKGNSIEEDLKNRDFSINSMAIDYNSNLIDPYNGVYDLSKNILRTIRKPDIVLEEDPIRILRAIRFYATHNMKPNEELSNAIHKNKNLLETVKKERISKELDKILLSETPSIYLREYGDIIGVLFPSLARCIGFDQQNRKWHNLDVYEHILKVVDATKNNLVLRMAALLHDAKKPEAFFLDDQGIGHFYGHDKLSAKYADEVLTEYHYHHVFIQRVVKIIEYHDYYFNNNKCILKFLYNFGTNDLDLYFGLRRADILGQAPDPEERIYAMDAVAAKCKEFIDSGKIITYKNLRIKGNDLVELGFEGEHIGKALEIILNKVINKQLKNDPDKLYAYAAELRFHMNEEV